MRLSPLRHRRDPDDDRPNMLVRGVEATERAATELQALATQAAAYERQQLADDRFGISAAAQRHQARSMALLGAAADRAHLDIDELLARNGPYSHHGWDSPVWLEPYHRPITVATLVQVGSLALRTPSGQLSLPFVLPVLGSNLIVTHDPLGRAVAHHLAQGYATRALASSMPGSIQVHLLDQGGFGENLGIRGRLPEPLAACTVKSTLDEISVELDGAESTSAGRNVSCPLVFAAGLDAGLPAPAMRRLLTLACTGGRQGSCVVAVLDDSRQLTSSVSLSEFARHAEHVHVDETGTVTWRTAPGGFAHGRIAGVEAPGHYQHQFLEKFLAPAAHRAISGDPQ